MAAKKRNSLNLIGMCHAYVLSLAIKHPTSKIHEQTSPKAFDIIGTPTRTEFPYGCMYLHKHSKLQWLQFHKPYSYKCIICIMYYGLTNNLPKGAAVACKEV